MKDYNVNNIESEKIEIQLLLEAIYIKYGYDFREYSFNHLIRRIKQLLDETNCRNISELQYKVLYDKNVFNAILKCLSINVTKMFRNPLFFKKIREEIVPVLKTYPFIKIWTAGCSTGEEAYSMAIILKEEGLLERSLIYGTDINKEVLTKARDGIYTSKGINEGSINYREAGGKGNLKDYFTMQYNYGMIKDDLKKNIVFSEHNLVTDSVFGEINLILCRNVFIYFEKELQDKTIKLFLDSLCIGGFLGLGIKEGIRFSKHYDMFDIIDGGNNIYQKKFI